MRLGTQQRTRLGAFAIIAPLGKGGMGEVYSARDTKLGRDVALKLLPDEFAGNSEHVARFEREARLLAALNHPNVATLYGFEEADGEQFLVMELVEGETLAERVARGPIPFDEAVPLFTNIAEGLEAAHEKGIVHRDLKPSNVKIGPDGQAKILDFGLAKAFVGGARAVANASQSPTLTKGTALGVILGTVSYMSPEQAKGETVDARTDIWAFGCCLFEALSGRRAIQGETVAETLASIIAREPDWERLPPNLPAGIRRLLTRALVKDARSRLQHIGDARIELLDVRAEHVDRSATKRAASIVLWAGVSLGLVGGAALVWSLLASRDRSSPIRHLELTTPPLAVSFQEGLALSPDGEMLLFHPNGSSEIHLRSLSEPLAAPMNGVAGGAPFFSNDGDWVAFFSRGKLRKVPISGGASVTICDAPGFGPRGGSWGADETIVFNAGMGPLMSVPASGGTAEPLTTLDLTSAEMQHKVPQSLPNGVGVLFQVFRGGPFEDVAVFDRNTGEQRVIIENGTDPYYSASGHLVFFRDGSIHVAGFDLERLELTSNPVRVIDDVLRIPEYGTRAQYALSQSGSLIYIAAADAVPKRSLVWLDEGGAPSRERAFEQFIRFPDSSPDDERVALAISSVSAPNLWIAERSRESLTRFTFADALEGAWSPDGSRIVFPSSQHNGPTNLYSKRADGSETIERLTTSSKIQILPAWSPDGRHVAFSELDRSGNIDIWILPVVEDRAPFPFTSEQYVETAPEFSPDGHWISYTSFQSGTSQVLVKPFPGPGEAQPISTEGGRGARWSPDGTKIFYLHGGWMMAADVTTDPVYSVSPPTKLFENAYFAGRYTADFKNYDVTKDGAFVMIRHDRSPAPTRVHVVLNWTEELKRIVPTSP